MGKNNCKSLDLQTINIFTACIGPLKSVFVMCTYANIRTHINMIRIQWKLIYINTCDRIIGIYPLERPYFSLRKYMYVNMYYQSSLLVRGNCPILGKYLYSVLYLECPLSKFPPCIHTCIHSESWGHMAGVCVCMHIHVHMHTSGRKHVCMLTPHTCAHACTNRKVS
jgi:hypothetical protein